MRWRMISLLALGCSGGGAAPPDASPDAVVAIPQGDCVQQQQAYVNGLGAPADVAATVDAVLATPDFPRAMPYCSGALSR